MLVSMYGYIFFCWSAGSDNGGSVYYNDAWRRRRIKSGMATQVIKHQGWPRGDALHAAAGPQACCRSVCVWGGGGGGGAGKKGALSCVKKPCGRGHGARRAPGASYLALTAGLCKHKSGGMAAGCTAAGCTEAQCAHILGAGAARGCVLLAPPPRARGPRAALSTRVGEGAAGGHVGQPGPMVHKWKGGGGGKGCSNHVRSEEAGRLRTAVNALSTLCPVRLREQGSYAHSGRSSLSSGPTPAVRLHSSAHIALGWGGGGCGCVQFFL